MVRENDPCATLLALPNRFRKLVPHSTRVCKREVMAILGLPDDVLAAALIATLCVCKTCLIVSGLSVLFVVGAFLSVQGGHPQPVNQKKSSQGPRSKRSTTRQCKAPVASTASSDGGGV